MGSTRREFDLNRIEQGQIPESELVASACFLRVAWLQHSSVEWYLASLKKCSYE